MAFATLEAAKPDVKTVIFDKTKSAECVQAYRDAGTFQTILEAAKPLDGKYFKVRG